MNLELRLSSCGLLSLISTHIASCRIHQAVFIETVCGLNWNQLVCLSASCRCKQLGKISVLITMADLIDFMMSWCSYLVTCNARRILNIIAPKHCLEHVVFLLFIFVVNLFVTSICKITLYLTESFGVVARVWLGRVDKWEAFRKFCCPIADGSTFPTGYPLVLGLAA